ncbi:MAG TPA: hypothetical protein DDW52_23525 [Planctomycetaceae bacterium]|nr:hypothetical protein [Planctomycetaceae bacterium]
MRDRHRMAALIGVSVPTLDRMVSAAEIPSLTIGNRRLFDADAVIEALTRRASE